MTTINCPLCASELQPEYSYEETLKDAKFSCNCNNKYTVNYRFNKESEQLDLAMETLYYDDKNYYIVNYYWPTKYSQITDLTKYSTSYIGHVVLMDKVSIEESIIMC